MTTSIKYVEFSIVDLIAIVRLLWTIWYYTLTLAKRPRSDDLTVSLEKQAFSWHIFPFADLNQREKCWNPIPLLAGWLTSETTGSINSCPPHRSNKSFAFYSRFSFLGGTQWESNYLLFYLYSRFGCSKRQKIQQHYYQPVWIHHGCAHTHEIDSANKRLNRPLVGVNQANLSLVVLDKWI
jgi:hypothetical protein